MFTVTKLLFADNAAAVGTSRESVERAARVLDEATSEWGLKIEDEHAEDQDNSSWCSR